jgi:hypothetical protein
VADIEARVSRTYPTVPTEDDDMKEGGDDQDSQSDSNSSGSDSDGSGSTMSF